MQARQRLEQATAIAHRAGRAILDAHASQDFEHRYKKGSELVTDADVAVDTLIAEALDEEFAGEARLTEELAPDRDSLDLNDALWIVDPIDGTVNFAHGLPHVAVSIAWASQGQVEVGVVHAPFLQETFTAIRGEGAFLNGTRLQSSRANRLSNSLIATGFPYDRDTRAPLIRRLTAILMHCQDVRRIGSAALDLCNVACGRLDAYYESVSPWDFAAGLLIAREAGAQTGHLYPVPQGIPNDLFGENILVSAPDIYAELDRLLKQADEESL